MTVSILPPGSIEEAILPLSELPDPAVQVLIEAISGPKSFSISRKSVEDLASKIGLPVRGLTYTLGALQFLYQLIADRVSSAGVGFDEAFEEATSRLNWEEDLIQVEKKAEILDRLKELLVIRDSHEAAQRTERLKTGFIPNAIGFSSFVDLRPSFIGNPEKGELLKLAGYLPVLQLRVTTDASEPSQRRLVFQINEEGLEELKKALSRVEDKLNVLRSDPSISSQIIR